MPVFLGIVIALLVGAAGAAGGYGALDVQRVWGYLGIDFVQAFPGDGRLDYFRFHECE